MAVFVCIIIWEVFVVGYYHPKKDAWDNESHDLSLSEEQFTNGTFPFLSLQGVATLLVLGLLTCS